MKLCSIYTDLTSFFCVSKEDVNLLTLQKFCQKIAAASYGRNGKNDLKEKNSKVLVIDSLLKGTKRASNRLPVLVGVFSASGLELLP